MFSHPLSILGYVFLVIGWFFLLDGGVNSLNVGMGEIERQMRYLNNLKGEAEVVNFHTLWIASGLIMSGGICVIAGILARGFEKLTPTRKSSYDEPLSTSDKTSPEDMTSSRNEDDDINRTAIDVLWTMLKKSKSS